MDLIKSLDEAIAEVEKLLHEKLIAERSKRAEERKKSENQSFASGESSAVGSAAVKDHKSKTKSEEGTSSPLDKTESPKNLNESAKLIESASRAASSFPEQDDNSGAALGNFLNTNEEKMEMMKESQESDAREKERSEEETRRKNPYDDVSTSPDKTAERLRNIRQKCLESGLIKTIQQEREPALGSTVAGKAKQESNPVIEVLEAQRVRIRRNTDGKESVKEAVSSRDLLSDTPGKEDGKLNERSSLKRPYDRDGRSEVDVKNIQASQEKDARLLREDSVSKKLKELLGQEIEHRQTEDLDEEDSVTLFCAGQEYEVCFGRFGAGFYNNDECSHVSAKEDKEEAESSHSHGSSETENSNIIVREFRVGLGRENGRQKEQGKPELNLEKGKPADDCDKKQLPFDHGETKPEEGEGKETEEVAEAVPEYVNYTINSIIDDLVVAHGEEKSDMQYEEQESERKKEDTKLCLASHLESLSTDELRLLYKKHKDVIETIREEEYGSVCEILVDCLGHSDGKDESTAEEVIDDILKYVSQGEASTDRRLLRKVRRTINKLRVYDDPQLCRMTIQLALSMKYVKDFIRIREIIYNYIRKNR